MENDYEMLMPLSQGSFGKAYLMRGRKDNKLVVVKKSHKTMEKMSRKEQLLAEREAELVIELGQKGSAFIIKGHEIFKTQEGHICIVTEYA